MTKKEEKYGLALAALIKDIGKFKVHASESGMSFKEETLTFLEENLAARKAIIPILDYVKEILNVGNHIILESENLSNIEEKIDSANNEFIPLTSILSRIDFQDDTKPRRTENYYYLPKVLQIEDVFPVIIENDTAFKNEFKDGVKKLYSSFINELNLLPDNDISSFVESLTFLLEKYLVYVGYGINKGISDVSLYDNSKTLAALSLCKKYSEFEKEPFLILAADVSGIQNFIYSEIGPKEKDESKAKRLRGKSFFLSLITDLFSSYILRKLDLPKTNLLMNGGGHFVIIAPNSKENFKIINECQIEIQSWFYKNFKGNLNLVLDTLIADEDLYKDFPKWYNEISSLLVRAKKQRSLNNIESIFNYDLDSMDFSSFRVLLDKNELSEIDLEETEYEKNLSLLSYLFEKMGHIIPYSQYIVQINGNYDSLNKIIKSSEFSIIPFYEFGTIFFFCKNMDQLSSFFTSNHKNEFGSVQILSVNDTDLKLSKILPAIKDCSYPISVGFRFMGNNVPQSKNKVLTFEEISKSNAEESGDKELAYVLAATLRMDVDNLGAIFSQGFERGNNQENIRTLSRTVALSREFNLFFSGYLNNLAEKWKVYITYSGGDDLFVVGSWINIIGFALQVKNDFKRFACDNPYITISGGIYLHKTSFPIGRAAQFAGEAETKAKNKFTDKNCISIFDREFKWDEFEKYLNFGKELDELIDKEDRPVDKDEEIKSSFLHFLLQQSELMFNPPNAIKEFPNDKRDTSEAGEFNVFRYFKLIGRIRYYIARKKVTFSKIKELDQAKSPNRKVKALSKLVNDKGSIDYLENLIIPASYVILKNRDTKNKQKEK